MLDLDETLVHSRIHEPEHYNYAISLSFDDTPFTFYVSERPHVHQFIKEVHLALLMHAYSLLYYSQVAQLYNVVIFTASMQEYAGNTVVIDTAELTATPDPVINQLDPHAQYFTRRLYREVCAATDHSAPRTNS